MGYSTIGYIFGQFLSFLCFEYLHILSVGTEEEKSWKRFTVSFAISLWTSFFVVFLTRRSPLLFQHQTAKTIVGIGGLLSIVLYFVGMFFEVFFPLGFFTITGGITLLACQVWVWAEKALSG
jgi:glucan phosphoethanolaminetransferase (alkaline phosphatase superfamily)